MMISKFYRKLLPEPFRIKLYRLFLGRILTFLRNFNVIIRSKFIFLFGWLLPKTDKNKAYAFMGKYGITSYPYPYMLEYKKLDIIPFFEKSLNLPFVMHNKKRLYFPEEYSSEKMIKDYRALIIEQDERSAHRYVKSNELLRNKTLLDIGSAEGIFALDTIELVNHVFLFEYSEKWLKALEATFTPWKEKVTIVRKYVCDSDNEENLSLDNFLKDKTYQDLFVKMDIEGAELSALNGMKHILRSGNVYTAICTYHRKGDPENISGLFESLGYSFEFTSGLIYWNKRLSKGLIRCYKK